MTPLKLTLICLAVTVALVTLTSGESLSCVPCDGVACTPPAPGCELGRRVCACCDECRAKEGDPCNSFSVECESDLVCFTGQGVFVGRPPIDSRAVGHCINYNNIPPTGN